jgi:hypothetical protein
MLLTTATVADAEDDEDDNEVSITSDMMVELMI